MAQLGARSTVSRCVVASSPRGAEHFGFPPSAPRLGNQRPWYVQPCLYDWACKRSRATYRKENHPEQGSITICLSSGQLEILRYLDFFHRYTSEIMDSV